VGRFILDFCAPLDKLVIEIDGSSHEGNEPVNSDRHAILGAYGYRVLRFTNDQVIDDMTAVLQAISIALAAKPGPDEPMDT
jgi:very-short-patch-repair endonuclease